MLSLILALGIHGLFLGMEFDWLKQAFPVSPKSRAISMTLTYIHPQNHAEKPVVSKPVSPQNKMLDKKQKQVVKSQPPKKRLIPTKTIKTPIKPVEKKIPQEISEEKHLSKNEPSYVPEHPQFIEETFRQEPEKNTDDIPKEILGSIEKKMEITNPKIIREAKPMYLKNSAPQYPITARKRGFQGTVVLEVFIDKDGSVGELRLFASSGHKILDRAAMASVKDWLFEPGMRGNEKVEMWVRVPIRFQLN